MEIEDESQDLMPTEDELFSDIAGEMQDIDASEEQGANASTSTKEAPKSKTTRRNAKITSTLSEKLMCPKTGIGALLGMFEGVSFKEDADESKNLGLLLTKYEIWAHRLFPRYPFEDVVEGIEDAGNSKKIKCHASMVMEGRKEPDDVTAGDEKDIDKDGANIEIVASEEWCDLPGLEDLPRG